MPPALSRVITHRISHLMPLRGNLSPLISSSGEIREQIKCHQYAIYVAKPQALAIMSPTQSVLLVAVGTQIFKRFVHLLMDRASARMFVHHVLKQAKQFAS